MDRAGRRTTSSSSTTGRRSPTALPHYGHLLTGYVKDVVPRYRTMRGQRVERRFGWDCHGLPAETEAEKELGVSGRGPITEYGIARFNEHCRTSVLRYTKEWERYVTRQARWVDFANDYKTMDLSYMESVMWAIKQLWDKGLLYEDYRVLPYCWECETPLSNSETRQDNAYRDRQDPAVTVAFQLEPAGHGRPRRRSRRRGDRRAAAGLGVDDHPLDAAVQPGPGRRARRPRTRSSSETAPGSCSARGCSAGYEQQLEGATRLGTVTGRDLAGRHYRPLFPYFADTPNAFVVLAEDFVTTEEGTGVVHMAPGFGEDDQIACAAGGDPGGLPGGLADPVHLRGARLRGPAGLRGQPARHPGPAPAGGADPLGLLRSLPTRTAGGPTPRSCTGP